MIFFPVWAQALEFKVDTKKSAVLTAEQIASLHRLLQETKDALPAIIQTALRTSYNIRIQHWETADLTCAAGPEALVELERSNRLLLNAKWIAKALSSKEKYETACLHPDVNSQMRGALTQILAEEYDRLGRTIAEENFFNRNCRNRTADPEFTERCDYLAQRTRRVSDTFIYSHLGHWSETFGRNVELFIFDPQYACRRPELYDFLRGYFGAVVTPRKNCNTDYRVHDFFMESPTPLDLNPDKVLEVHYLHATAGEGAGKYGHSMLRLVICDDEIPSSGTAPDCRKHLRANVAISYRALVADAVIGSWKGIRGEYPSKIFFLPLEGIEHGRGIIDEYTVQQSRDLISIPLKMTREQIRRLINTAVDQFRRYESPYKFFSHNCATETLSLLKAAYLDDKLFYRMPNTPRGVADTLLDLNFIDKAQWGANEKTGESRIRQIVHHGISTTTAAERETLVDNVLIFQAESETLRHAFDRIKNVAAVALKISTLDAYLKSTTPDQRKQLLQNHMAGQPPEFINAVWALEDAIFSWKTAALRADINNKALEAKETHAAYFQAYKEFSLKHFYRASWGEYGLPLAGEAHEQNALYELDLRELQTKKNQAERQIEERYFKNRRAETEAIRANIRFFANTYFEYLTAIK